MCRKDEKDFLSPKYGTKLKESVSWPDEAKLNAGVYSCRLPFANSAPISAKLPSISTAYEITIKVNRLPRSRNC